MIARWLLIDCVPTAHTPQAADRKRATREHSSSCTSATHLEVCMPGFAVAVKQADTTQLPVVEGITVQIKPGASIDDGEQHLRALLSQVIGGTWDTRRRGDWIDATTRDAVPPPLDR